jgi:cysteine desulfurase
MIYFDNAATTHISKNVKNAIVSSFDAYGNASSQYELGRASKSIIHNSRSNIEKHLKLPQNSFIFTGCGSESDTFAIQAGFKLGRLNGRHKIVISAIEHHAVIHAAEAMKQFGAIVEIVRVDNEGFVDLNQLREVVDKRTAIVSIMASNNEIGTIQNISAIAKIAHDNGALFHTDAVQGIVHMDIDVSCVDMMSISGHKFNAPKGIGGIYINPQLKDKLVGLNLIAGGKQEFGLRAGTENIPYIVGLAQAVKDLVINKQTNNQVESSLSEYMRLQIKTHFPYAKINGPISAELRHPGIVNICFGFADAASIVEWMNLYGICISSGSACNTGSPKPSHVLTAIGRKSDEAFSSIRVSFSHDNTKEDIDEFINAMIEFEKRYKIDE